MTMRSPILAMLWEQWQLTRVEAAQRFGLGTVGGSAALLLFGNGATIAFWTLLALNAFLYLSIAKLNGGRFMDGYKPGFPFYLLYARPVPTVTFVGVAMAYDAITCAALYLVNAALLVIVFGQPLPFFPVAALIVFVHLCMTCIQWSTRSRAIQWIGTMVITWPAFFLLKDRATPSHEIEFSLAEYALMFVIGIVAIALTVAGVARQRCGDAIATVPRAAKSGGYPDWLVNLFRFRCPTSSATRAQMWFELKSSGLPALTIGLGLAMLIFLLFAISISVEVVRPFAIFSVMASAPALLFLLGGNAFGIRRRQGRTYASSFEATQPNGTSQLVALKVFVRTVCVLAALIVVGVSAWASTSLLAAWGSWVVEGGKDAVPGLLKSRREIGAVFAGMTGYLFVALPIITSVAGTIMVASLATFAAVRARYPRRLLIATSVLLLYCLALVLLALAAQNGIVSTFLIDAVVSATRWIASAAIVFTTIYLFWRGFAERVLTIRYACGALVISALFAAAWIVGMPATNFIAISGMALMILMIIVLAPWSLSRIRHI